MSEWSSIAFQYCEYYQDYEGCKKWLEENLKDEFGNLKTAEGGEEGDDKKK